MSAATATAQYPLTQEGQQFWEDLVSECKERVNCLNQSLGARGLDNQEFVRFAPGSSLRIYKGAHRAMEVHVKAEFYSWGPVISGAVRGYGAGEPEFSAEEFEFTVAKDVDGSVVAIYDQGKSFSARDLSCYLMQNFRRCYPKLTLPC